MVFCGGIFLTVYQLGKASEQNLTEYTKNYKESKVESGEFKYV